MRAVGEDGVDDPWGGMCGESGDEEKESLDAEGPVDDEVFSRW